MTREYRPSSRSEREQNENQRNKLPTHNHLLDEMIISYTQVDSPRFILSLSVKNTHTAKHKRILDEGIEENNNDGSLT